MTKQKAGNQKRFIFSLITLMISLVIALVLAEGLLRILGFSPKGSRHTVNEEQFRRIPGMYEPHKEILRTDIPELPHRITINKLGFRGEEFSQLKPPGETRVFVT